MTRTQKKSVFGSGGGCSAAPRLTHALHFEPHDCALQCAGQTIVHTLLQLQVDVIHQRLGESDAVL